MTDEQRDWLGEHPGYSAVKRRGVVAFHNWTDEGWLWPNGKFSPDDGNTLFWFPKRSDAMRVGRKYSVV